MIDIVEIRRELAEEGLSGQLLEIRAHERMAWRTVRTALNEAKHHLSRADILRGERRVSSVEIEQPVDATGLDDSLSPEIKEFVAWVAGETDVMPTVWP